MGMMKPSCIGLAFVMISASAFAADPSPDSAQQALQQLRLLQQRLSQTPPSGTNASSGSLNQTTGTQTNQDASATAPVNSAGAESYVAPPRLRPGIETAADTLDSENDVIDRQAFRGVERQRFPLTPDQILRLKKLYESTEFANVSPVGTPPKPTATSQFVNLSPGSTPPVIRLAQGFVSSLVFLDSTGAPWPIHAYDLGDPSSFNIQWDKTSNTLMIQSLKLYTYGNLAVRLRGLNTPVMLTLIPGQKAVDYRVDLQVQGYGPNAQTIVTQESLPPQANDLLLQVLDGVPPPGSKRLTVSGGEARAWLLNERIYVRTNLTVLSPGWIASMTSADGMHAYEMQKAPVLLVSWHGKVMQLKVEGL